MLVCDGLKGLPDAVNAVWEKTIVQTCIVHEAYSRWADDAHPAC
jgi:transposase-like protein